MAPSGLKAALNTSPTCALPGSPPKPRFDVPDPRRFVVRGRDDACSIRAEGRALHGDSCALPASPPSPALRVPDPRRFVARGGDNACAIRAERRVSPGPCALPGSPPKARFACPRPWPLLSFEAVTIRVPSGVKRRAHTSPVCPSRLATNARFARPRPEPCCHPRP